MSTRAFLFILGFLLLLGGVVVLLSGSVSLPTRSPITHFQFSGASLLLLGATPVLAGGTCIAVALQVIDRHSKTMRLLIGAGIVMLGLSFLLAPKA